MAAFEVTTRPFGAQVILNGHEFVAAQAQKAGVKITKQEIASPQRATPQS